MKGQHLGVLRLSRGNDVGRGTSGGFCSSLSRAALGLESHWVLKPPRVEDKCNEEPPSDISTTGGAAVMSPKAPHSSSCCQESQAPNGPHFGDLWCTIRAGSAHPSLQPPAPLVQTAASISSYEHHKLGILHRKEHWREEPLSMTPRGKPVSENSLTRVLSQ